ncbi:hypothetical protein BCY84_03634 [Trypanosoma cruzi cruzi]|uniref:Uncharacterized protein n=2 Tax=Trypanosoma cruzi TaxID=5693 RepID=A0A2V2UZB0_TRYCR|nr:hypothetical protein BCY84_03634 [Trypanosoma cruzi cruzi]PWU88128.1 hypothetical protein C4B63_79g90 [Trypanosoma cruzi]
MVMRRCIVVRSTAQLAVFLREVVQHAPSSGISLVDVESEIKERMQAMKAGADVLELSSSWREALTEVNGTHFISGTTLYPCNWEEKMQNVAASIPYEGVIEKELIGRIIEEESRFLPAVSLGEPISKWVQRRFSNILWVSRSATNGTPIYRAVGEPLSMEAECIARVLQLLGRRKLPVYTDVNLIVPLLPVSMSPKKGNWLRFFERQAVQDHFDVDVEAYVRVSPDCSPSTVFVDATSVEAARVDDILAAKGILDSLCAIKVFRRPNDPVWSTDDVIVQSFLEPEHAIGAAIALMEKRNDVKVYILCGDGAKERYKTALGDLLGQEETIITICTPNSNEEISVKKR